MMKLGLSSYTYPWAVGLPGHAPAVPLDENGLLDCVGAAGLHLLQIGDNLPLHTVGLDRLERLARRALGARVELQIGARRLVPERVAKYAEIARLLGANLIRVVIDDTDYHPTPADIIDILLDSLKLLDGLTLAIENHDRFTSSKLRAMIETVGSDRLGVCLDTVNSIGAGEGLETVVRTLAPVTVNLHIKDYSIARVPNMMGFEVAGRPAGAGFLDLPWLLKQLEKFPRCQTAVLEQWPPAQSTLEKSIALESDWAQTSLRTLKPFFAVTL
jgi:sugar phosphate isomerase/epimerase